MPISNTVEANIVVNFEDRFSGPAYKAFEQFRKYAGAAFQAMNSTVTALFNRIESGIDKFVNAVDRFSLAVDSMVQKNKEVLTFGKSLDSVGRFFRDFWKDMQSLPPVMAVGTLTGIIVGLITITTLAYSFPLTAAAIAAGAFLIFSALDALGTLEKIDAEVKLKDEASGPARLIRKNLESVFRNPIVQDIQASRRNINGPAGPSSGAGGSDEDEYDGKITLRHSGNPPMEKRDFPPAPSFASGIRFVPRDMLARIHKGETVLSPSQAERFRGGGSGGDNITFHITGGLTPDQATARKFARMMEDERIRLNERKSI